MATYYIDWVNGLDTNDGLSEKTPKQFHNSIDLKPGDTVLFKRGNMLRNRLDAKSGTEEGRITYGAYGEGENPVFCGSEDVSSPDLWVEEEPNLWRYSGEITDEPCNIIYNNGAFCGKLCWEKQDMKEQGDWYDMHLGNARYRRYQRANGTWIDNLPPEGYKRPLYIRSEKNPGEYYNHIEYVTFKKFGLSDAVYANFDNLTFINSGVHGITCQHDASVTNCKFEFLGGACFNRTMRIRLGNGVESFQFPKNVLVENCFFNNIFDSCITYQGFWGCTPADNCHYRNNLMMNYGMAAYEVRDHIPTNTTFTDNICIGAGLGFAKQDDIFPRNSEIYPFPMGHHVFIWRIAKQNPTPGAKLEIKNNIFYDAPVGAAIFSFILAEPEKQYDFDYNTYYTTSPDMINRMTDISYKPGDFDKYVEVTGQDKNSKYEKVDIREYVRKWFKDTGRGEVSDKELEFYGI